MTANAAPRTWENRIVGHAEKPVDEFLVNPWNWRLHTREQYEALTGLLDEVGWVTEVIENVQTGHLIDGHARVLLADRTGQPTVPVTLVDLSPDEELKVLAALDPIASMARSDDQKLAELLGGIKTESEGLGDLLGSLASQVGASRVGKSRSAAGSDREDGEAGAGSDDGEPAEDDPRGSLLRLATATLEDPEHLVGRGEVWSVGRHVLVCSEVVSDWRDWIDFLDGDDCLFVPYPGPFVALTVKAEDRRLVMVQPDPFIAGHVLDRFAEIHGASAVSRR